MTRTKNWLTFYGFVAVATTTTVASYLYTLFCLFFPTAMTVLSGINLTLLGSFLSFNLVTLFYAGFVHSLASDKKSVFTDERSLIGVIGVAEALLIVMQLSETITPTEGFIVLSLCQTASTFLFFKHSCSFLKSNTRQLKYLPAISAGAMAAFALAALPLRNWFPVATLMLNSVLWQACVVCAGFLTAIVLDQLPTKFGWSISGIKSLFSAAAGQQSSPLRRRLYVASHLTPAACGICVWAFSHFASLEEKSLPMWMLAGCSPLFFPALLLAWATLREQAELNTELIVSSRLAGSSALRLLKRNPRTGNAWAASIGIRTSVFTIDHDPDGSVVQSMPASIVQIRNEEIQRCITDVLKTKMLHQHTTGQKIFGALDSESSSRPCMDIIKLFACLYLDAGPLVERRINGLSTLLPIINPGLAKVLKTNVIADLLKRNQWFFHFDYHWVDQHLINTPGATRYGVHIDPIPNDLRQAMVTHLKRANGMGSFIWMGKEAQEKLLQEAPMLTPIIEPMSVATDSGGETLVFILKFEHLIPRLQRYFDLDHTRKVLMDYEPGTEASKLINIFKVQSTQATTPDAMINLVESISSYPWRGFKEKDQALKIVIAAHQYTTKVVTNSETQGVPVPRMVLKLREAIQVSVEKIGYPAQILHIAQMKKIAQRDLQAIVRSVTSLSDSRFEESWTLLGSLDFKRYIQAERQQISRLFSDERVLSSVLERADIQPKAIDTLVNLIRAEHFLKDETIEPEQALTVLSAILSKKMSSAETLTLLFDGVSYVGQLFGRDMNYILVRTEGLETVVKRNETGSMPYASSLWSRWLEIKQKMKNEKSVGNTAA